MRLSQKEAESEIVADIVVAILGLCGTLAGSFLGVVASQKLTQFRLAKLEEQVKQHNHLVERTYRLEGQVEECMHDIRDLKAYHKPQPTVGGAAQ